MDLVVSKLYVREVVQQSERSSYMMHVSSLFHSPGPLKLDREYQLKSIKDSDVLFSNWEETMQL